MFQISEYFMICYSKVNNKTIIEYIFKFGILYVVTNLLTSLYKLIPI